MYYKKITLNANYFDYSSRNVVNYVSKQYYFNIK